MDGVNDVAQSELARHETVIAHGLQGMVQVAESLRAIRDNNLYEAAGYDDFESYVAERWRRSVRWAQLTIQSADVAHEIQRHLPDDVKPPSRITDTQALKDLPPQEAADIWTDVVAEHGETPTVEQVRTAVGRARTETTTPAVEVIPAARDKLKREVPAHLAEVFNCRDAFRLVRDNVRDVEQALEKLAQHPGGRQVQDGELRRLLREFSNCLRSGEPHTECPRCRRTPNNNCKVCLGTGWVTKGRYDANVTEGDAAWLGS